MCVHHAILVSVANEPHKTAKTGAEKMEKLIPRKETFGKITCAEHVANYAAKTYATEDTEIEHMFIIYMNAQNEILCIEKTAQGTTNHVNPILREIFKAALLKNASALICIHNHPSGKVEPSMEDRIFTKKLVEAGKILQVKVLDHVIVGDTFFSFQEQGEI